MDDYSSGSIGTWHRYSSVIKNVMIGSNVTSIGNFAFQGCRYMTSVTIGEGITSIGNYAFYDCIDLTMIHYNAKAVSDLAYGSNAFDNAGRNWVMVTFGDKVKKIPTYLFYVSNLSARPNIAEITFTGNAPTIGDMAFYDIAVTAYYPYGNATWTEDARPYQYGNGYITWKPYSDAEAVSAECTIQKDSYMVGDTLDTSGITMTINRSDGCVEEWNYAPGAIQLGTYDMAKTGWQTIDVTCKDASAKLNIYVHDKQVETSDSKDYPASSRPYENNLDKTYTYQIPNAQSMQVTFSDKTVVETNVDYIYVNGVEYTGTALAGKTIAIDGDTLNIRMVTDGSDSDYGFSIDKIVVTSVVHEYTATETVASTCTEEGYTTYRCACGESYRDSYVAALGRDFGEWTFICDTQHQRVCTNDTTHVEVENHHYVDGKCDVCGYIAADGLLGDVNNDGKVNQKDVARLRQYLADSTAYPMG